MTTATCDATEATYAVSRAQKRTRKITFLALVTLRTHWSSGRILAKLAKLASEKCAVDVQSEVTAIGAPHEGLLPAKLLVGHLQRARLK